MALKRDRVNRVKGLVYLPIDGSRLVKGDKVFLSHIKEAPIDCEIKDAMEMEEPINGDAVGDAVFDAMPNSEFLPSVIGDNTSDEEVDYVFGFEDGNFTILLDTGDNSYGDETEIDNICDPMANEV